MSDRPAGGRIAEIAAHSPVLAGAGAEITREIVLRQVNELSRLRGVIAHVKRVTEQTTRTDAQKVERIGEVIAEYEKENR